VKELRTRRVGQDEAGLRLDRWFRRHFPDLGHGQLEKLLRTGQVRIDGRRAKSGTRLAAGQNVRIPPLPAATERPAGNAQRPRAIAKADAEALRGTVLYRDEWIVAIDKPAGLAVQGGSGQRRHLASMLEALRFGAEEPPRLVHRLDKDTSGVLLLARDARTARHLSTVFRGQQARKLYWAAVAGVPVQAHGRIALALAKKVGRAGEKMQETRLGQEALTLYQVAARRGGEAAWLVLRPLTGRTHQLRVHCAALGHPILGDGKYGGKRAFPELRGRRRPLTKRLQLHAREIAFPHPADGTTLRITAPLPPHMAETWAALGFNPAAGEAAAATLEDEGSATTTRRPKRRKA
jgi:23S rRNA pseudouridine955/2504/2580 synthase